ncbi:MAG TPA: hypothetical protein DCM19_10710 [Parasutterella excrementihominis]|uniref:Uncharacterized protein n=2 Tax=Parasutterella excrementihominis TaxID=487175 RepID=F3QN83_9BURK|nr:hypothetical protein HMPREF0189_02112 [Burkholderiales bacterium 1_1_47]EGG51210.1 hypothetical protein HMPREF9439_02414 [Parasutterella excrementihominis YIT 11859]KAA3376185.1 hypothetical protein F1906_13025 [Akkermansia muciniphila]MCI9302199.1 hypothetical protein [Parasutterella excrementihominis]RHU70229.1 hypothetical protein DXC76_01025 [Burkholderiales bacterium]HCO53106.1 hypothetical protein [Sutterellaceae bacterium]
MNTLIGFPAPKQRDGRISNVKLTQPAARCPNFLRALVKESAEIDFFCALLNEFSLKNADIRPFLQSKTP